MKNDTVLLASFMMIPVFCLATSISDPRQRLLLDRMSMMTSTPSEGSTTAFELLKLVALGRTQAINAELEARAGLAAGEMQQKEFSDSSIRAYAFRKIGESVLPEAIDFLARLIPADVGLDPSQQIWPAVQEALANALLNRISYPESKIEFLERTVVTRGPASYWAVEQLCNRGALSSLAIAQKYIKESWTDQYGEVQSRFCEARMRVVFGNPDRVKAFGSILRVDSLPDDDKLVRWAIYHLNEMRTPSADGELSRFTSEIGRLPKDSPRNQRLSRFKSEIDSTLDRNQQHRSLLQ